MQPRGRSFPFGPLYARGVSWSSIAARAGGYARSAAFSSSTSLPDAAQKWLRTIITLAAARWVHGDRTKLKLGNLEARRDWEFAGDYIRAMHAMLQRPEPKDYVIGTGKSHSIAEFIAQVIGELNGCNGNGESGRMEDYVEVDVAAFGRHLRSARAATAVAAPHQL